MFALPTRHRETADIRNAVAPRLVGYDYVRHIADPSAGSGETLGPLLRRTVPEPGCRAHNQPRPHPTEFLAGGGRIIFPFPEIEILLKDLAARVRKMDSLKLSLCIPTYNFGRFIAETLHSILEQDGADEIEVVVVDGASTDNTPDVVANLQNQHPQIKYFRLPAKGGIDRDMAKSVELASGEYCWLFSSDDTMVRCALKTVLNEIKQGHDLYLCKHTECTFDMQVITEWPILSLNSERVFDLANPQEREKYASLATTSEAFFSFMGGLIVKKSKWDSVPLNEAFIGSCWGHAARLFEIMPNGLTVKYMARAYLNRRSSNDSFSDKGVINRHRIGIEGYNQIADVFFGHDSVEAFHVRRVLKHEYPLDLFIRGLDLCKDEPETESKALLDSLIHKLYCDGSDDDERTLRTYAEHSSKLFPAPDGEGKHDLDGKGKRDLEDEPKGDLKVERKQNILRKIERHILRPVVRTVRSALGTAPVRKKTADDLPP
jgi:abequosyltransferase